MSDDHHPIIVGGHFFTDHGIKTLKKTKGAKLTKEFLAERSPSSMMARAANKALEEVGIANAGKQVTTIATVQLTLALIPIPFATKDGETVIVESCENQPQAVASKISGATNASKFVESMSGGNSPAMLVNAMSERLSKGEIKGLVVIAGSESLASFAAAREAGVPPPWGEGVEAPKATSVSEKIGADMLGASDVEMVNGLREPRQMYPLMEQAWRVSRENTSVSEHLEFMGRFMSKKFNAVASGENKGVSWFPSPKTPSELITESPSNRWIGFPYPKNLNSVMNVDQGAAIVMTTKGEARRLGVPTSKWVEVLGCGDAYEPHYFVSERRRLDTSVGMGEAIRVALEQAKLSSRQIDMFDLYSCFPIAVENSAAALGLDLETETRPLTVTGGLPYFGGAGNAYVLFAFAAMHAKLRSKPGLIGLVNGNGWFMSKHAATVLRSFDPSSTKTAAASRWERESPKATQARLDARYGPTKCQVATKPSGVGVIRTLTVDHSRRLIAYAIGDMLTGDDQGKRFVARLDPKSGVDPETLVERDAIGARVKVATDAEGKSSFSLLPGEVLLPTGVKRGAKSAKSKL